MIVIFISEYMVVQKYTLVKKGFKKSHLDFNDFLLFRTSKDFELAQISKNCTSNFCVFYIMKIKVNPTGPEENFNLPQISKNCASNYRNSTVCDK